MFLLVFAESIQLFPDGTLFIHIALILLMIWVLNRTFFKPINRIIESREKSKGGHSSEADAILSDVNAKQARYTQELLKARSEGYELIEKERDAAIKAHQDRMAQAKNETAGTVAASRELVAQQTAEARAVIVKEAEAMADSISKNILKG